MDLINEMEKIYLTPGCLVKCSKLDNSPTMYVLRKKELTFKDGEEKSKTLQGFVCRWFTADGFVQEAVFSSKDLQKLN